MITVTPTRVILGRPGDGSDAALENRHYSQAAALAAVADQIDLILS